MQNSKIICPFTTKEVDYQETDGIILYNISAAGKEVEIKICKKCLKQYNNKIRKHVVYGLIINGIWPSGVLLKPKDCDVFQIRNVKNFEDFLADIDYPKTPKDKLESFFLSLYYKQGMIGETNTLFFLNEDVFYKNYFESSTECILYFRNLLKNGWINSSDVSSVSAVAKYNITYEGLEKFIEIKENGENSNKCFIAMSFKKEAKPYRIAIKAAIEKSGFIPIIIDDKHLSSDEYIPDAILANIKQAKFCIADFTFQSKGVYFEAGYAVGQGKQVIYTCEKKDFDENSHFDIKQLQHILYKDSDELEKKLIEKIKVWIN